MSFPVGVAIALHAIAAPGASAQTPSNLRVDLNGYYASSDGGERLAVTASTGPIVIGQVRPVVFTIGGRYCFGVSSRTLDRDADGEWSAEVVPLKVAGDAVTFRLKWSRSKPTSIDSTPRSEDIELTLRPGESLTLDAMSAPPPQGSRCLQAPRKVLRVSVEYEPRPSYDRRLVETALWLVEKRADGSERNWPLQVRGQFNQASTFFFDTISDNGVSLDVYGEFRVFQEDDGVRVAIETRSRVTNATGSSSNSMPMGNGLFGARKVESDVRLRPADVVALELPRLSENDSGAFADRAFSIRLRTRQLR